MNTVILDARPREAYEAGHLEGAIHADLETQLSSASTNANAAHGGRHPLPPIERWLAQVAAWGITPDTMVYVYDDQNGANAAARAWWMLRAIGHANVAVFERNIGVPPASHAASPHTTHWQLPTVSMSDVDRLRHDPQWRVLDVRATPRYRGETEPIDPVAGHIPGAINLPFTENVGKTPEELRAMYTRLFDGVPPERVVVHCGSGVTACHTLLALDQAGMPGASLYVGSWGEWCRNPMPIGKSSE
jgi:thiosulfate/3-mercaptopyruvate sulfurtransferase